MENSLILAGTAKQGMLRVKKHISRLQGKHIAGKQLEYLKVNTRGTPN